MPFRNRLTSGNTLINNSLQSTNYVFGVSGWRLGKDGSSQLGQTTIATGATGARILLKNGVNSYGYGQGVLQIYSGTGEFFPAELSIISDGPLASDTISTYLQSPGRGSTSARSQLQLFSGKTGGGFTDSSAQLLGQTVAVTAYNNFVVSAGKFQMNTFQTVICADSWYLKSQANQTRSYITIQNDNLFIDCNDIIIVGTPSASLLNYGRGYQSVGATTTSSASGGTSAGTAKLCVSVTVTLYPDRIYKFTSLCSFVSSVAGDRFGHIIKKNGSIDLLINQGYIPVAGTSFASTVIRIYSPDVLETVTIGQYAYRTAGTGLVYAFASATQPAQVLVEDIGRV